MEGNLTLISGLLSTRKQIYDKRFSHMAIIFIN